MTPGKSNGKFSKVEDYVVKHEKENSDIRKLIKIREIIGTTYENLELEKKKIINYLYFEGLTQVRTSFKMQLSENTIGKRKIQALKKLKENGILRAWEIWEGV
jgi:DNA-directed RNA polymerase specialized sigma subunit